MSVMLLRASSMLPGLRRNHFGLAACLSDLLQSRFRKQMRGNTEWRLQFAVSKNLQPIPKFTDQTALHEELGRDRFFRREPREILQVDDRVALLEDVRETTLGKPAVQR